jgi:hypothetical protein
MKNLCFTIVLILSANIGFSQLLPTGTVTTDNKYRSGGIGIGYSTAPSFGTNKFLVNGSSIFSGGITINSTRGLTIGSPSIPSFWSSTNWGIKSDSPFIVSSTNPFIKVYSSDPTAFAYGDFAVATVNGGWSERALKGDVVLRSYTSGSFIFANEAAGNLKFVTKEFDNGTVQAKTQMIITKTGNIGIGTETPDTKLAVNGTIHAREVIVDLVGWPDYVFQDDYNLMSLEELEKSININKHLPNIPSACEIENNGIQLGQMNKKLIEKVEELTLYIIQLNKELQEVKSQLKK